MTRLAPILALLGCTGDPEGKDPTTTPVTADTGTEWTGPGVRCTEREDNVLLWDCQVVLERPDGVGVFLEDPTGALRALEVSASDSAFDLTVWRLHGETAYTLHVVPDTTPTQALSTTFVTSAVPAWAAVQGVIEGQATRDYSLLPFECGGAPLMVLLDRAGEVVWYLDVNKDGDPLHSPVSGFDVTPEGTVLAVVGRDLLREWTWTQERVLDLGWPGDLPSPIHHDVYRHQGYTYVLTAQFYAGQDGVDYVMDGVLVFDDQGALVTEWNLSDQYVPSGGGATGGYWNATFPGAVDWAHANGVHVADDLSWRLSFRAFDAVLKVNGDWTQPDFGTVAWALSPDEVQPMRNDFTFDGMIQPGDFRDQHHPSLDSQGRLVLFDNRENLGENSRATVWDIDEAQMVATLEEAWALDDHCLIQGSAFALPNQHIVATCATSQTLYEFVPGAADPVWTLQADCAQSQGRPMVVRAMPLDFDD